MGRRNWSIALIFVAAIFLFYSFSGHSSVFGIIFWLAILVLGLIMLRRAPALTLAASAGPDPSIPPGFRPAYYHTNIALDTAAGQVWLRDGARSRVFNKSAIIGIQALYDNMQGLPTMVSNGVVTQGTQVKKNIRIAVQTTDLDHPTYTVRFPIRSIFKDTNRIFEEALSWANRLNAFLRT